MSIYTIEIEASDSTSRGAPPTDPANATAGIMPRSRNPPKASACRPVGIFCLQAGEDVNATQCSKRIEARMSMETCLATMEREVIGSACSVLDTGSSDVGRALVEKMMVEITHGTGEQSSGDES